MSSFDVTTSFARTLVDEWVRNGITAAVVSPGSRNTPLTLALVRDGRMRVDVVLDERSAGVPCARHRPGDRPARDRVLHVGYRGREPASCGGRGAPRARAAARVHRRSPAELRDWGAGQTIDQAQLFGGAVRWFHDPGPPEVAGTPAETNGRWRRSRREPWPRRSVHRRDRCTSTCRSASRSYRPARRCSTRRAAPTARPGSDRRCRTANPDPADVARLTALVRDAPNGLLVAGWGAGVDPVVAERFARAAGWPVVADPLSQLRTGSHAVSTYEGLLRVESFVAAHRPDLVVRVGAPVTSKVANAWLDGVPTCPRRSRRRVARSAAHRTSGRGRRRTRCSQR